YLGGEAVAEAAVDLLLGKVNPCGKLAETWPLRVEDTPCYEQFGYRAPLVQDVEYRESIYVGYRYYETFRVPVRYEFGYGLSYTTFLYENLRVIREKGKWVASCSVSNRGKMAGKETVQLYVKNSQGDMIRPAIELRGFQKIFLEPGETKEISFTLTERDFSVFDTEQNAFVCVEGEYDICMGASVRDIRLGETIRVEGQIPMRGQKEKLPSYFPGSGEPFAPTREDFVALYGRELSHFTNPQRGSFTMKNSLRQLAQVSTEGKVALWIAERVGRLMTLGKPKNDPEVMMMIEGICDGNMDSVVNQSNGLVKYRWMKQLIEKANR
ncbi:MAG: fibronectin type III-like domain-contianing protein, partial [Lachnospiraceae bacterium]|nr:fibronectin type III-like domain-contianing protein [Lachnospiraceae bacterium]